MEAARLAREAAMPSSALGEQIRAFKVSPGQRAIDQALRSEAIARATFLRPEMLDGFRIASEFVRGRAEQDRLWLTAFSPAVVEQAQTVARLAQSYVLPDAMERFRTPIEPLAGKMLGLRTLDLVGQPAYIEAFARTSAMSNVLSESIRVGRELREATQAFAHGTIPAFDTLGSYRNFLDAAGLQLPHWPRPRLLSTAEKRKRFRERLKEKAEPTHLRRAKSLVHRYELTLRDILDAEMAKAYGEDWAERRLPLCGCKDLLGKWRKRGGDVLDHADYAHYSLIMSHPEHFSAVFEAGFDDPTALAALFKVAGNLRAASHHGRAFTPEDLRDLRVTWRTIETGLLAFADDYVMAL